MRIYIAGPYTKGDVAVNVRNAIAAANQLALVGHFPFVPHLSHFWHLLHPRPWQFWLAQDLEWLKQCEALLRLPGESAGADQEEGVAKALGIPVYHSVLDVPRAEGFGVKKVKD